MRVVLLALFVFAALSLGLAGCDEGHAPPLVEIRQIAPRDVELGDRVELIGSGFPQGHAAHVTFRGRIVRPGEVDRGGATIEAVGEATTPDRVEVVVGDRLEEQFCGSGDAPAHATFRGDVDVAFASNTPGAAPVQGTLHDVVLDVRPSSVRATVAALREAEGLRVLSFLGIHAGPSSPRGLPVERVEEGGAAARLHVESGDVITSFDGVHVTSPSDIAPRSGRSAELGVRKPEAADEEIRTVPMTGYANGRVPSELLPAIVAVVVALAVIFLLFVPGPALLEILELRVTEHVRRTRAREMLAELFGRGPELPVSLAATVLVGTLALGPYVLGPDVDGAALAVATFGLLVAARARGGKGLSETLRAMLLVSACALALVASACGALMLHGAMRLGEVVHAQGGAPWQMAATRNPAVAILAVVYLAALTSALRLREDAPTLSRAGAEVYANDAKGGIALRMAAFVASALFVALFLGGWQLPGIDEADTLRVQVLAGFVFASKAWLVTGLVLAAARLSPPWSPREVRLFVVKRLGLALLASALLSALWRRLAFGSEVEDGLGASLVILAVLFSLRAAVRVHLALTKPAPRVSSFL